MKIILIIQMLDNLLIFLLLFYMLYVII